MSNPGASKKRILAYRSATLQQELINRLKVRDVRASGSLDRQIKVAQNERYQIAILNKAGHDQSEIAQVMNRHPSTISRELRWNRGQRRYRPKQAHEFSQVRMRACENGPRVTAETWAVVDAKLAEAWSPEQIAGHLKANEHPTVRPRGHLSACLCRQACWWHPASRFALPKGAQETLWRTRTARHDSQPGVD